MSVLNTPRDKHVSIHRTMDLDSFSKVRRLLLQFATIEDSKGYPTTELVCTTTSNYISMYYYVLRTVLVGHWQDDKWQVGPAISQSGWRTTRCRSTTDAPITVSGMGPCTVRAEKWLGFSRRDWPLSRPIPVKWRSHFVRPSPVQDLIYWYDSWIVRMRCCVRNTQHVQKYGVCTEYGVCM